MSIVGSQFLRCLNLWIPYTWVAGEEEMGETGLVFFFWMLKYAKYFIHIQYSMLLNAKMSTFLSKKYQLCWKNPDPFSNQALFLEESPYQEGKAVNLPPPLKDREDEDYHEVKRLPLQSQKLSTSNTDGSSHFVMVPQGDGMILICICWKGEEQVLPCESACSLWHILLKSFFASFEDTYSGLQLV